MYFEAILGLHFINTYIRLPSNTFRPNVFSEGNNLSYCLEFNLFIERRVYYYKGNTYYGKHQYIYLYIHLYCNIMSLLSYKYNTIIKL